MVVGENIAYREGGAIYVQITTKCNMRCDHCCFSCEPGKGEDMSRKVWKQVLEVCDLDYVTLGGGEPTVHPDFERILMEAIGEGEGVEVITNGKNTKRALLVAKLAKKKVINAQLSRDDYHEDIDPKVVDAFVALGENSWNRRPLGIRNTTMESEPGAHGRALETYYEGEDYEDISPSVKHCMCEDHIVKPNGDVVQCGCEGSPVIGNVFDGWEGLEDECGDSTSCYRRIQNQKMQPA